MINEERLRDYIGIYMELKKDLWWINRWGVQKIDGFYFNVFYNGFAGHWQLCWNNAESEFTVSNIENIFETEADAKEFLKYGNITRTEKLELPMWEEFCKLKTFVFESKERKQLELAFWVDNTDGKLIKITDLDNMYNVYFEQPLTRENYDLARDLCIKLWGGEREWKKDLN